MVRTSGARRYAFQNGQPRALTSGSPSATPMVTNLDVATRYAEKMDARYNQWRNTPTPWRGAMGPESAEARERRINRISHQLASMPGADWSRLWNANADELAEQASSGGQDNPYLYH